MLFYMMLEMCVLFCHTMLPRYVLLHYTVVGSRPCYVIQHWKHGPYYVIHCWEGSPSCVL